MEELNYTCCFCNKTIHHKNPAKINISINNQQISQEFYCHMGCFTEKTQDYSSYYEVKADDSNNIVFFNEKSNDNDSLRWNSFLNKLVCINDDLIVSIFKQSIFLFSHSITKKVYVEFPKDFVMFEDLLINSRKHWLPILQKEFNKMSSIFVIYKED